MVRPVFRVSPLRSSQGERGKAADRVRAVAHGKGRPYLEVHRRRRDDVAGRGPRLSPPLDPRPARGDPPPMQVRPVPLDRAGAPRGRPDPTPRDVPQLRNEGRVPSRGGAPPESLRAHRIAYPPSTTRVTPVMNDASSEQRNTAFLAISSGAPRRFRAASCARDFACFSESPAIASVSTAPGAIAFTWTLSGPRSWASPLVSASTPAFATKYGIPVTSPVIAGVDPTRTIAPRRAFRITGIAAWAAKTEPRRSTRSGPRNASSVRPSNAANHTSFRNGYPA